VLSGKPVSQAAINQTLTAMLQGAGIDAYPLFISTRKAGRINRSFPSLFQFNGQLVYSKIGGKSYFMDASFPYSRPNLIPVNDFNKTGLALRENGYQWVHIQPVRSVYAFRVDIHASLDRSGNLSGRLQAQNGGYPARKVREKKGQNAADPQIIAQLFFNGYSKVQISDATAKPSGKDGSQMNISGRFKIKNYAVSFKNGLQFRPMVVGYLRHNPFRDSTRTLPITLDAPEHLNLTYHIQLPQGMKLTKQPQNRTIRLPGAVLKERYNVDGSTLQYQFKIDIYRKNFSTGLYPRLLSLYQRLVQLSHMQWYVRR
jgi:hypothetical protein